MFDRAFASVKKLGFTMIELLIVIAVLGILAVAVLAAINPIEQINRGRDTGSRSDAEQLISAIDRFYASQGYYPWQIGADDIGAEAIPLTDVTIADFLDTSGESVLEKLSTGGTAELKTSYIDRIDATTYNTLQVYNRGTQGDSTYVCFLPKSGAFAEEAEVRCGVDGNGLPNDLSDVAGTICAGPAANMVCLP